MLQLTSSITFSMNVGDFFELQRPFHRNRPMNAAPQEQGMLFIHKGFCPFNNLWFEQQNLRHRRGQMAQLLKVIVFLCGGQT